MRGRCERCNDENLVSEVRQGMMSSTCMGGGDPYWDQYGEYHHHDPNYRTREFSCSQGHRWTERDRPACSSCLYGLEPPVVTYHDG